MSSIFDPSIDLTANVYHQYKLQQSYKTSTINRTAQKKNPLPLKSKIPQFRILIQLNLQSKPIDTKIQ